MFPLSGKKIYALFASLLVLLSSGCTPNLVSYYRPTVEGGKSIAGRCVPIESRMEFAVGRMPVDALVISVQSDERSGVLNITLSLHPFPLQALSFSDDRFTLHDMAGDTVISVTPSTVRRDDGALSLTTPYNLPGETPLTQRRGRYYEIVIALTKIESASFELQVPPLFINGTRTEVPPIRFERKTWMGISPFNC